MARSIGLAAYRALARRRPPAAPTDYPDRPRGELVWIHVTSTERLAAALDLGRQLGSARPGIHVLVTTDDGVLVPDPAARTGADWILPLTEDHPVTARHFLTHWAPDIALWAGAPIMPNLIDRTAAQGIALILLDAESAELGGQLQGWMAAPTRAALALFDGILAVDDATAALLRRHGMSSARISVAGRLRPGVAPPRCSPDEQLAVSARLGGRAVWLAAGVTPEVAPVVLGAHRNAARLSHRLLLALVPVGFDRSEALIPLVRDADLRLATGDPVETIDDNVQVFLAEDEDSLGLWLRLAPVTLMAGTLTAASTALSPLWPAALGSAVLHGPHLAGRADEYDRLAAFGGVRPVHDADDLARAVITLLAPDRAAEMALAGWQAVSEGAELIDRLLEKVQDTLDLRRVARART